MNRKRCILLYLLLFFPFTGAFCQQGYGKWAERLLAEFPFLQAPDTVSVVIVGDVMMHTRQIEADYEPFLSALSSRFKKADLSIANLEFTLAGPPYSGYPVFSAPDRYADYIHSQGINVFLTANNHILDKGSTGLARTLSVYRRMEKEQGIRVIGVAENEQLDTTRHPLMVQIDGIRLALINFTYGTNAGSDRAWPKVNRMTRKSLLPALERAKRQGADYIIALPHWGMEYQLQHSQAQEEMAIWLAENGVDVIVGAHPHVVQDYDEIKVPGRAGKVKSVPVFYSLGNAVSNMSAENTRLELMVTLRFTRDNRNHKEFLAPEAEFLWCTLPGRLTDSFCTVPIRDYRGRKEEWKIASDYDLMMKTYWHVKKVTGIED